MAPFYGFGRLATCTVQACPDVESAGTGGGHRLDVRLVMIGHDLVRYHAGALDGLPKERLCTCSIAMLAHEHIHHDAILVDGSIQVPLVSLTKQEHLVDEPARADRRSTVPDLSRQSGPEGLDQSRTVRCETSIPRSARSSRTCRLDSG
jgi:hypothetical protein